MISGWREKVTVLAPVRTADEGGGYAITYEERDTVTTRTETRPTRSEKRYGQSFQRTQRRFTIRYKDDLVYEMRLRHRGTDYHITDIQEEDDRRRFQTVTGVEVGV